MKIFCVRHCAKGCYCRSVSAIHQGSSLMLDFKAAFKQWIILFGRSELHVSNIGRRMCSLKRSNKGEGRVVVARRNIRDRNLRDRHLVKTSRPWLHQKSWRANYACSEKFWIRPKTGFLTHNFGYRYAIQSIKSSIDADCDLEFNKTLSQ